VGASPSTASSSLPHHNMSRPYSDILTYFEGPPGGSGPRHDAQAEAIASHGRKFTETRWRWEDMQSFMLLMMLEVSRWIQEATCVPIVLILWSTRTWQYHRAFTDDREAASYIA
jgi:hypothetical protein